MEKFSKEKLEEAINKAKSHLPSPLYIVMPQWWVEKESAANPNDFIFYDDGTITWCGYTVYTYGDRYENN